jgi:hypothetical protein
MSPIATDIRQSPGRKTIRAGNTVRKEGFCPASNFGARNHRASTTRDTKYHEGLNLRLSLPIIGLSHTCPTQTTGVHVA